MFRRGLNFLKPFDWVAIVGSALAIAFCLLVLVPWEKQSRAQTGEQRQTCEYYRANGSAPTGLFNGLGCWIDGVKDDLEAVSTGAVALFTIVLAYSTIGLWKQTDRLAEGAEKSSRRQLRAYVEVNLATLTRNPGVTTLTGVVQIKNCGSTPAYKLRTMSESFSANYPLTENRPHPEPREDYFCSLGPGQTVDLVQRFFASGDQTAWFKEYKAGTTGLWLQGTVLYEDCFGAPHKTRFRMVAGGRLASAGELVFHADQYGNDSD